MNSIILCFSILLFAGNPIAKLPRSAIVVIDSVYPGWALRTDIAEYDLIDPKWPASPCCSCYVNADSLPDYAIHIIIGKDSSAIEHFIVLLSEENGYRLVTLRSYSRNEWEFGNNYLQIFKAGTEFDHEPFEGEGDHRKSFRTDCVSVSMREKNACMVFLFDAGQFKTFSPCD